MMRWSGAPCRDFADALILCKAGKTAAVGDELSAFYNFDDAALQLPDTKEL